jgi:integrase
VLAARRWRASSAVHTILPNGEFIPNAVQRDPSQPQLLVDRLFVAVGFMPSLEFDNDAETYRVRFRFAGRAFKRSLHTTSVKRADAAVARIDEMLMLVAAGRLEIPAEADPIAFIMSDGKRRGPSEQPLLLTLGELISTYQDQRIPGAKEDSTIRTENMHLRHILRGLKKSTFVKSIRMSDLQAYVVARLKQKYHGHSITAETVRKELGTLRIVWNWGMRHGLLDRPAPLAGLEFPKRDERHPFRTWDEITAILARGGISTAEVRELWESLYLTREEIHEVLKYAKGVAKHAFIYPLLVFVAHSGMRISEALRSRIEDIDLAAGKVVVREKKRSRIRATTFRRVDMTPMLIDTMKQWLSVHPGGLLTFCKEADLNRGRERHEIVSIDKHAARKHFKLTFRGSRWAKLRGYHVFRHSFASNLAAQGVDQRIIDAFLGHQTEEMRCRYRHLLPQTGRAAILKLLPGG